MGCEPEGYYKSCIPWSCEEHNMCQTIGGGYTHTNSHSIVYNYAVSVCDVSIPIFKTNRTFSVQLDVKAEEPESYIAVSSDTFYLLACGNVPGFTNTSFSEDLVHTTSTIHFIDIKHSVVLYKQVTETILCTKMSSETCGFHNPTYITGMLKINDADYTATKKIDWILVIGGVANTLKTSTENIKPFSNRGTNGLAEIILHEQPSSAGIPGNADVLAFGFYDYSDESALIAADGGKDYFYPLWCRNLTEDPIWRAAADRRYQTSWEHAANYTDNYWLPPGITVDPIPVGNFIRHNTLGDFWQFICDGEIFSSRDITTLLNKRLIDGNKTHDYTAYFPFGLTGVR